jgi:hypothetical protein
MSPQRDSNLSVTFPYRPMLSAWAVHGNKPYRRAADLAKAREHIITDATMYCQMGMSLWLAQT